MHDVTREELQRRLDRLKAAMPGLIERYHDPGEFNSAFAELADDVTDYAAIEDEAWAFQQIDQLLERYGLWQPGQEDLPPDE